MHRLHSACEQANMNEFLCKSIKETATIYYWYYDMIYTVIKNTKSMMIIIILYQGLNKNDILDKNWYYILYIFIIISILLYNCMYINFLIYAIQQFSIIKYFLSQLYGHRKMLFK